MVIPRVSVRELFWNVERNNMFDRIVREDSVVMGVFVVSRMQRFRDEIFRRRVCRLVRVRYDVSPDNHRVDPAVTYRLERV